MAHQPGRKGTAEQSAEHESIGRGCDAELDRSLQVPLLDELRSPRGRRAMAAGQRDRAGDQTVRRMKVEHAGERHAEQVLQQQRSDDGDEVQQQHLAALDQRASVRGETDRREEHHVERRQHRRVELDADVGRAAQQCYDDGKQHPADDRGRHAVALQECHAIDGEPSDHERDRGKREGPVDVDAKLHYGDSCGTASRASKRAPSRVRGLAISRQIPDLARGNRAGAP